MTTTISPVNAQKVWVFSANGDGTLSPTTFGGGGGSGTVTSIATTSPITGGTITTTGTIACATCTTNAAALTNGNLVSGAGGQAAQDSGVVAANIITSAAVITNNVLPKGNGARGLANSSITDDGTTVSTTELVTLSGAGAASAPSLLISGAPFTGGSGTTTFPQFYINKAGNTGPTTFATSGTLFGINAPSGFAGFLLDFRTNGSTSRMSVDGNGTLNGNNSSYILNGSVGSASFATYNTNGNCNSAASPAVCASSPAGSVVIAAAATTVVVNTTRVTANSQIIVVEDSSLSTRLGVTCNTQSSLVIGSPAVTARVAATSFTITVPVAPTTNPVCLSYTLLN